MEGPVSYTEESIQVLEGLEAVRKRPAMYIGSTDNKGLHHLVYEIIDNAVDEALAGVGDEINVVLHRDDSVSVPATGGVQPARTQSLAKPTTGLRFAVLHGGGTLGGGGYKASGGLHGVRSAAVTALSGWLRSTRLRSGERFPRTVENGG